MVGKLSGDLSIRARLGWERRELVWGFASYALVVGFG